MNRLSHLFLSSFILIALPVAGCTHHPHPAGPEQEHALTVQGQGEARAEPDLATVRLGVEERAVSAQHALSRANEQMSAVIEALQAQGVAAKDIQTTNLSVSFRRDHRPPTPIPHELPQPRAESQPSRKTQPLAESQPNTDDELAARELERRSPPQPKRAQVDGHYVVNNTVVVRVRQLDRLGQVIGEAMKAGANSLHGLEFSIEDPEALSDKARERAIEHALDKAKQMAKTAGVKLGPVVRVNELGGGGHPGPHPAMRFEVANESASVPTETGQLTISQQVEVVFSLN